VRLVNPAIGGIHVQPVNAAPGATEPAIRLQAIHQEFQTRVGLLRHRARRVTALEGLSLDVNDGELFGLLGPNGAGKTTTIKILATLLIPTAGTASVLGLDVVKHAAYLRSQIGFVLGGERGLYYRLSGRDNLRYFAELYAIPVKRVTTRIDQVLELVGLQSRADDRVEGYSRGMKQRLHLARTLLHEPRVLLLDEPTIGLDPVGARQLRQTIQHLHQDGKTILLTTHYMFEADALCERIAVMKGGRILAEGKPDSLKALVSDLTVVEIETFGVEDGQLKSIRDLDVVDSVTVEDLGVKQLLQIQTKRGAAALPLIVDCLEMVDVGKVSVREATLEDAYVRLMGQEER